MESSIVPGRPGQGVLLAASLVVLAAGAGAAPRGATPAATEAFGRMPRYFEANRGQVDPQVRFLSRGRGHALFLTGAGAVLALARDGRQAAVRIALEGANPRTRLAGVQELPGKVNYFVGHDPAAWRTDVPTYARVRYDEPYPGIDMVFYGNERQIEFDFVVAPGADPRHIRLAVDGAASASVDPSGDLVLVTSAGDVRLKRPDLYQETPGGGRHAVAGGYTLRGKGSAHAVGFRVGEYDRRRPLVIDPVLVYATMIGGVDTGIYGGIAEAAFGLALDSAGNAYLTGWTTSVDFPTKDPLQPSPGPTYGPAFVTKVNPQGTELVYSTYFGVPPARTTGYGIAVDGSGAAYIVGTSYDIPTTPGAFQPAPPRQGSGEEHGFVTKLSPAGNELVYSTWLAGGPYSVEEPYDVAVDGAGHAYVTGYTTDPNFPAVNPIQPSTAQRYLTEAFVSKLNPTGTALVYSTPLGGSDAEQGFGIAVDAAGRAYVTGVTNSSDFPLVNAAQPVFVGGGCSLDGSGCHPGDAFVARISADGSALEYSTYLGGSNEEFGKDIAVDAAGSAYVTGLTWYGGFPTTAGAFQPTPPGGHDAFVTKLSPDGAALAYSTYLGGSNGRDEGHGIAVDGAGNAYVTGSTSSTDFPLRDAFQPVHGSPGGVWDAFVTEVNPAGSALVYSSYLGGNSWENYGLFLGRRAHIAVDAAGRAYVSGWTSSPDFPTTPQAFQRVLNGSQDAFVVKVSSALPEVMLTLEAVSPRRGGNGGTATVSIHGTGFDTGTAFRLARAGQPEIAPLMMTVPAGGNVAAAVFDLRGKATGAWDVVARDPDGTLATLPGAFTIEAGGDAGMSVQVIGPIATMRGYPTPYTILVGNRGLTDAYGILVFVGGLPKRFTIALNFDLPRPPGLDPSWSPFIPDPLDPDAQVLPLFIPVLRAGETLPLPITLTSDAQLGCAHLRASVTPPLLRLDSGGAGNLCEGLIADAAGCLASLPVPGPIGCALGLADALRQATCNALEDQSLRQQARSGAWLLLDAFIGCADGGASEALRFVYEGLSALEACSKLLTGKERDLCIISSLDPNDKVGALGAGEARYVPEGEALPYLIRFENKPDATAPAHEVVVTDQLDPSRFDFTTFAFGPIRFGDTVVTTPPGSEFTRDVDLRPARDLIVRIHGRLDKPTGLLTWTFASLDPATGEPTADPFNGFLPPNQTPPEGDGSVFFTVLPKEGLPTGTEIRNQARIVFDLNDPIDTPQWLNTIDTTRPASQVLPLPPTACAPDITWSGTDEGAGIRSYTVLVSENDGPYSAWLAETASTSAPFTGVQDGSYAFYTVARDAADNLEAAPPVPDATVTIHCEPEPPADTTPPLVTFSLSSPANAAGWHHAGVTVTWSVADPESGVASSEGCAPATLADDTPGTTLTCTATNGAGLTASESVTVKLDQTPPVLVCSASPRRLWPPDHRLVAVTVNVAPSDALSGAAGFTLLSATSNQPDEGTGDGDTAHDVQAFAPGTPDTAGLLRAERSGDGPRVYSLTYEAADQAGNTGSCVANVRVPRGRAGSAFAGRDRLGRR